jgi:ABC-type nickel/cobalt efflux system permease component RcnA
MDLFIATLSLLAWVGIGIGLLLTLLALVFLIHSAATTSADPDRKSKLKSRWKKTFLWSGAIIVGSIFFYFAISFVYLFISTGSS